MTDESNRTPAQQRAYDRFKPKPGQEIQTVYPDRDARNADWPKVSWDIAPYRSPEFMAQIISMGLTLEQFKRLPIYQFAVDGGLIVGDRWQGGDMHSGQEPHGEGATEE